VTKRYTEVLKHTWSWTSPKSCGR